MHGKLAVTVADTGLGFGKAATAGTGVGLANIRERLQLLYGNKASLTRRREPAERHGRDDHRAVPGIESQRRRRTHERRVVLEAPRARAGCALDRRRCALLLG